MGTNSKSWSKWERRLWSILLFLGIWILSFQLSAKAQTVETASDCQLPGADCVAIPRVDWNRCRQLQASGEACTRNLRICTKDGKAIRKERDECSGQVNSLGQLFGSESDRAFRLQQENAELIARLNRRQSPAFWVSMGLLAGSIVFVAAEGGSIALTGKLSVPRTAAAAASLALGAGLVIRFR